jgi:translin
MQNLEETADRIHQSFEARTKARDLILSQARTLTRHCANAIRAVHRDEHVLAQENLAQASLLVNAFRSAMKDYPDLYYAGYTQDSLKEFAEASIVYALVNSHDLPSPEELGVEHATYLQGLAEAVGELRRRSLDVLLHERSEEAVRLLEIMDDIYAVLVTMDYPDAITGGLRRLTDVARSIIERTRGDLTLSLRQEKLEHSLQRMEQKLSDTNLGNG